MGAQLSFKSNKGIYSQGNLVNLKFLNQFCLQIYQWLAGWKKQIIHNKLWMCKRKLSTSFTTFFSFKDVLIGKHELSSLENIWLHAKVDIFEPILHIYQCLAGWKKQIMYE